MTTGPQGLTSEQVAEKIAAGKVNRLRKKTTTKTVPQIIWESTFTIFNLVNLVLAGLIIIVDSYKNLLFLLVAIANTMISIVNEIRAKRIIDKLKLQSGQKPTVIRDGQPCQIFADQIVEGDLLVLSLGDQILVDGQVVTGEIEVNESYVTGEQDSIAKKPNDKITSGSFVVSGTCTAEVTSVGAQNFLAKLEASAKSIKPSKSEMFNIINTVVKRISFALIPIGILLLISRFRVPGTTPEIAVTSTVAALISMIPEGLVLLVSSVLALATIRLAKKSVLVQDLYSIETLARVDTICLDKTGTLTTGKMRVKTLLPATDDPSPEGKQTAQNALENALMAILSRSAMNNATGTALKEKLPRTAKFKPTEPILEPIPFSSERKYSGVRVKNGEILMGALEFLTQDAKIRAQAQKLLATVEQAQNYRVIAVLRRDDDSSQQGFRETLLGLALLEDELRSDASEIVDYFKQNDVAIRIISGDSLETVKTIAEKVGVPETRAVDMSTQPHPSYARLVDEYQIFTRVTPQQKKRLIEALKAQKRTVAMTGDGVNDILAMKEADCSIAIGEGADAARRAARLVLLDSNFAAVPSIIDEGRQAINNLERSAIFFLTKTVYASILAVLFAVLPLEYPYAPIEMTLLNVLCIGLPGFVLAFEKNTARVKNQFAQNIKKFSLPTGIAIAAAGLILAIIDAIFHLPRSESLTLSMVITFAISLFLVYRVSKPLNKFRAGLLITIVLIFLLVLLVPPLRRLFIW